jgi:hypothetical protein
VRNKLTAPTLSPIGVWTGFRLGFGRFSVGEGTLQLGNASTKKMSPSWAWAGHWAAGQCAVPGWEGEWKRWPAGLGTQFGHKTNQGNRKKLSINFQHFIDCKFIWNKIKFKFLNDSYPRDKIQGHFITQKNVLQHERTK